MSAINKLDAFLRKASTLRNVKDRVEIIDLGLKTGIPCLEKALYLAYNPYIRFGLSITESVEYRLLAKCTNFTAASLDINDPIIWDMLEKLSTSTASSKTKLAHLENLFERLSLEAGSVVIGILKKSLISGVKSSTVNKAKPGLIPSFGVQLANKYTPRKVKKFPVFVEPKYDGMRATAIVYPTGEVEVLTRTGRPIHAATLFHVALKELGESYKRIIGAAQYEGLVVDGELLGDTFNDTVSIFRKNEVATSGTFRLFDAIPLRVLKGSEKSATYKERRLTLEKIHQSTDRTKLENLITISPCYLVNSKEEIWSLYEGARTAKFEGLIVKAADGLWQPKRSNDWLKIKAEETLDLVIIGGFEGEGELLGTLGGLIVDFKGVEVRVGSGFSHAQRDELWKLFMRDLETSATGSDDFVLIGCRMEVQYQEVTPAGSLRHPVFVRLRMDKDEASF